MHHAERRAGVNDAVVDAEAVKALFTFRVLDAYLEHAALVDQFTVGHQGVEVLLVGHVRRVRLHVVDPQEQWPVARTLGEHLAGALVARHRVFDALNLVEARGHPVEQRRPARLRLALFVELGQRRLPGERLEAVLRDYGAHGVKSGFIGDADTVAAAIAAELDAEKLILVTGATGILEDVDDPGSLISYIDRKRLSELKKQGSLADGMLPKAAAIDAAISNGVSRVHVISYKLPDSILLEVFTNEGTGTLVVNEPEGLRSLNEKLSIAAFADLTPRTYVSRDQGELREILAAQLGAVTLQRDQLLGKLEVEIIRPHPAHDNGIDP